MSCRIQVFLDNRWHTAAEFTVYPNSVTQGIAGKCLFGYEDDFTLNNMHGPRTAGVSLTYPINFSLQSGERWPAFLLDILPTGAGRRVWTRRLSREGSEISDYALLTKGAGNPPGNIRVAEAVIPPPAKPHTGFTREEIIEKNADFIEYAEERGALVAGATDVAGDAPKFLVTQDRNRRWHPDGSLEDHNTSHYWLVKFARGTSTDDALVLKTEAAYYEIARDFGIRTGFPLEYRNGALFIQRFDRRAENGQVVRYGLETLCSLAGISAYGVPGDNARFCAVIAEYSEHPAEEVREYLRREVLNVALRNTDNHGRNTSVLKYPDGKVELSPLYDFAPMFLDPDGIPRASRWQGELEPQIGRPDWRKIAESLTKILKPEETKAFLAAHADRVARLPEKMRALKIEDRVIDGVSMRTQEIASDLRKCTP